MKRLSFQLTFLLCVCVSFAAVANASQWQFDNIDRVVAISDIHGAYGPMVATLQNAGVLDDELAWSGGGTHLVIVGDILDRGPKSRAAMDLLMRVEDEAAIVGGKVHVLIGNHEAMNLVGDLRYVSKAEYAAFADDELAEDRDIWFAAYAADRGGAEPTEALRAEFDRSYPIGFFAHRRAFSSSGRYGRWLSQKPVVVVINETAFVHGGVSPMIGQIGLDGVNGRLRQELVDYLRNLEVLYEAGVLLPTDNFYEHPMLLEKYLAPLTTEARVIDAMSAVKRLNLSKIHASDGPLWYRGNIACNELVEEDRLDVSLRAIGAKRVVIGHTPTLGRRIMQRFDGRIYEVDTGMLNEHYAGSGNALVMEQGRIFVINQDSEELFSVVPHPRRVGSRQGGYLDAADIEQLLASGNIASTRQDEAGRQLVTVSNGLRGVEAVFAKQSARGFYPEVAAYRLDRLLELDMVPVTAMRELDGEAGSLQFLPYGSIDEVQRAESGKGSSATCPLADQWDAMFVFDALIYNDGRFAQSIRYSQDNWQLLLVGHNRAFARKKGRPKFLQGKELNLTNAWKDALTALSDDVLEDQFSDVLDKKRRRSLGARRNELLGL
ncbi:MAG: metallophosphoesterase [Gammaproteobacteria bacterium]|nr:metallophosphoesterase [Gammaproteobacteria bacterium]